MIDSIFIWGTGITIAIIVSYAIFILIIDARHYKRRALVESRHAETAKGWRDYLLASNETLRAEHRTMRNEQYRLLDENERLRDQLTEALFDLDSVSPLSVVAARSPDDNDTKSTTAHEWPSWIDDVRYEIV